MVILFKSSSQYTVMMYRVYNGAQQGPLVSVHFIYPEFRTKRVWIHETPLY